MSVSIDLRVLELVCSRLCHDLVSPVGAINNGVELIRELEEDDGSGRGLETEALELIAHSAEQAARRLRVLRLAYGAAGADVGWDELRAGLDQFFTGSRVALSWAEDSGFASAIDVRGFTKVVLNTVLLAADSISQNGTITVEARPAGAAVLAVGRTQTLDAERSAALSGRTAAADLDPRSIQAYMTGRFAAHYGVKLSVAQAPERLEFSVSTG